MNFGKRNVSKAATFNATDTRATMTLADCVGSAKSERTRAAFATAAEWMGPNTPATAEVRKHVASLLAR